MRSWSPVSLKISSGWDCGFLWFDFLAFVSLITRISVHVFFTSLVKSAEGFDPYQFAKRVLTETMAAIKQHPFCYHHDHWEL